MSSYEDIKYLEQKEIDKEKWDRCIATADNSLIYAHSFYLDLMSTNWDALAWGNDYKNVMPLPWKKKFGIKYLYQPFLTAQLGVFGKNIDSQMVEAFISAIPSRFRLIEISLNKANYPLHHAYVTERNNYVMDLNVSYEVLYNAYNDNTKRNIKKAIVAGCRVQKGIDIEELIKLAVNQMNTYESQSQDHVDRFRKLYNHLRENNAEETYGIISADEKLIASTVFFIMRNRAYYILVGNHPESKATGASHALIDGFIRDHAGKPMILDFEGSDIPSLAMFYGGFGAMKENYPFLKINRLPFYLKWFKK